MRKHWSALIRRRALRGKVCAPKGSMNLHLTASFLRGTANPSNLGRDRACGLLSGASDVACCGPRAGESRHPRPTEVGLEKRSRSIDEIATRSPKAFLTA
jgi:hypothetical protein